MISASLAAVAALEGVDQPEPLLERGERRRVVVDRRRPGRGPRRRRRLSSASRPASRSASGSNRGSSAGQAARLADGDRDRVAGARSVGGEGLADGGRSPGDRLAMLGRGRAAPGSRPPRPAAAGRPRSRPPRARAGRPGGRARAARSPARPAPHGSRASARPPPAIVAPRVVVAAVRVEQVALPALVEQPLLVVLAVDLDERADLVGQPRRRRRHVVDPGGRAAGRSRPRGRRSAAPARGRTAPRPARPPRRGGSAPVSARAPMHEPERVDQQALAGAGLAADDVEPGRRASAAAGRSGRGP